ncbi:MAG: tetratricopeptide repeat protein, partial [Acidobacteria bacterium]|nr:tetratricopeptide repeat protein [Acidobacteriota bacterium]
MIPTDIAKLLLESSPEARLILIREQDRNISVDTSEALQAICYEVWTEAPQKVAAIAETLKDLAEHAKSPEVQAYSEWVNAIKALVDGELEKCVGCVESSEAIFTSLGKMHPAAKTQTSKLYALALLGRYDEAADCGIKAREIFIANNDHYSAGKIEHNIGNLFIRRDMYREAEPYFEMAHARFTQIDDQRQLAMVENCQAFVKMFQNEFRDADTIYRRALERSSINKLAITEAEIEASLSKLYLFEGKYDLALKFMERSRVKYEVLEMPNQSYTCELEIADIYLELNLLPEAVGFYRKVESRFAELGMQAELAFSSLSHARALLRLGKEGEAAQKLDLADDLFQKEGNLVAAGSVKLERAQMLFKAGDPDGAERYVELALTAFEDGKSLRLEMFARWLRSEIWSARGRTADAESELNATLALAKKHSK